MEVATITYAYLMELVEALARGAKGQGLISGVDEFMAFRYGAATRIRNMARERKAQTVAANPGGRMRKSTTPGPLVPDPQTARPRWLVMLLGLCDGESFGNNSLCGCGGGRERGVRTSRSNLLLNLVFLGVGAHTNGLGCALKTMESLSIVGCSGCHFSRRFRSYRP